MRYNYYHVSVLKDTSGIAKDVDFHHAEFESTRIAEERKRKVETGAWTTKLIGQTPTRWVFRVRFQHADFSKF